MASSSLLIVTVTVVIAASLIGYAVRVNADYPYTGLKLRICNGKTYSIFSSHYDTPGILTEVIAKDVLRDPIFLVYHPYITNNYIFYGHGYCFSSLDRDQCAICMNSARDQLFDECSWHGIGAQIELLSCKLRYEVYDFEPVE